MAKLFVLRDDDLNYFTRPEDIIYWYQEAFSRGIPVSFSTVPFVKGISDVYTDSTAAPNTEYAVGNNVDLVEYVRSNIKTIEITQHGCTHQTIDGVYEFGRSSGLFHEARRGYDHLTNIFGNIQVFVAPHDTLSNHGIKAVESIGLNILRSKGMRNFLPRFSYVIGFLKMIMHRLHNMDRHTAPAYPYVLSFGKHKEAYSYRLHADKRQLFQWLEFAARKNTHFIITNHVHDRDDAARVTLYELIDQAQKLGYGFVKAKDLFV